MKNYENSFSLDEFQAIGIFAEKSLAKLRRLQDCIEQQAKIAYDNRKDDALWHIQRMDLIIAAAVDKKCFEKKEQKMETKQRNKNKSRLLRGKEFICASCGQQKLANEVNFTCTNRLVCDTCLPDYYKD